MSPASCYCSIPRHSHWSIENRRKRSSHHSVVQSSGSYSNLCHAGADANIQNGNEPSVALTTECVSGRGRVWLAYRDVNEHSPKRKLPRETSSRGRYGNIGISEYRVLLLRDTREPESTSPTPSRNGRPAFPTRTKKSDPNRVVVLYPLVDVVPKGAVWVLGRKCPVVCIRLN